MGRGLIRSIDRTRRSGSARDPVEVERGLRSLFLLVVEGDDPVGRSDEGDDDEDEEADETRLS